MRALSVGICVTLQLQGSKKFVISAHLPHKQRQDCVDTWPGCQEELENALKNRRLHDNVVLLTDSNYELGFPHEMQDPNSSDERRLIAGAIMQNHGLVATQPSVYTWSNQRGSSSKIDFVLLGSVSSSFSSQGVFQDSDFQLGCDHRAIYATFELLGKPPTSRRHRSRKINKCGKWRVDSAKLLEQAARKAEALDLGNGDLDISAIEDLSSACSFRPKSLRCVDSDLIRDKIKERRLLGGADARALGKEIAALRKEAKTAWLTSVLDRASKRDFFAISYFKRRNSVISAHSNYVVRAGGKQRAVAQLRQHFSLKYTPADLHPPISLCASSLPTLLCPIRLSLPLKRFVMFLTPAKLVSRAVVMVFLSSSLLHLPILTSPTILLTSSTLFSSALSHCPIPGSFHISLSSPRMPSPLNPNTFARLSLVLPQVNCLLRSCFFVFVLIFRLQ